MKEASEAQLRKLWKLEAFAPMARRTVPRGSHVFHHTWVNEAKGGVYKSRFTCADVKHGYTAEEEPYLKVFVPTPIPEAHSLLEVRALQHGHAKRRSDIVAAFLIGQDRGAQTGEYVHMRAPPEWKSIYEEWVQELPPAQRIPFEDVVFRLDGNLYGRHTAGSLYRDELAEILRGKLKKTGRYDLHREVKKLCMKTGLTVVHHTDDGRRAGKSALLDKLLDEDLPQHCEITSAWSHPYGTRSRTAQGDVRGQCNVRFQYALPRMFCQLDA